MAKEAKKSAAADWLDEAQLDQPKSEPAWRDMLDLVDAAQGRFPNAGCLVVLLPEAGARGEPCVWRSSRQFIPGPGGRGGRFEQIGFWSLRNAGGQRINWEPVGWRPYEEPTYEPRRAS